MQSHLCQIRYGSRYLAMCKAILRKIKLYARRTMQLNLSKKMKLNRRKKIKRIENLKKLKLRYKR